MKEFRKNPKKFILNDSIKEYKTINNYEDLLYDFENQNEYQFKRNLRKFTEEYLNKINDEMISNLEIQEKKITSKKIEYEFISLKRIFLIVWIMMMKSKI